MIDISGFKLHIDGVHEWSVALTALEFVAALKDLNFVFDKLKHFLIDSFIPHGFLHFPNASQVRLFRFVTLCIFSLLLLVLTHHALALTIEALLFSHGFLIVSFLQLYRVIFHAILRKS